jgi:hypothetical protein
MKMDIKIPRYTNHEDGHYSFHDPQYSLHIFQPTIKQITFKVIHGKCGRVIMRGLSKTGNYGHGICSGNFRLSFLPLFLEMQ